MPTIVFATPKGGAGKSTSAALLATQLSRKDVDVTVLDADRNEPLVEWAKMGKLPENITVIGGLSETTILDEIDAAAQKTPFVIVDLEGTASMMVGLAISQADLVIVPMQGSRLDAKQGARAIKLIQQQEKALRKKIPYAVLFTRTSEVIRPRTLVHIEQESKKHQIPAFITQLHERDAYKALFSFGGTLESLDPMQVRNLEKAIANAREFMTETIAMLRSNEVRQVVNA